MIRSLSLLSTIPSLDALSLSSALTLNFFEIASKSRICLVSMEFLCLSHSNHCKPSDQELCRLCLASAFV